MGLTVCWSLHSIFSSTDFSASRGLHIVITCYCIVCLVAYNVGGSLVAYNVGGSLVAYNVGGSLVAYNVGG